MEIAYFCMVINCKCFSILMGGCYIKIIVLQLTMHNM